MSYFPPCECGYLYWRVHILSLVLFFNSYYRNVNVDISAWQVHITCMFPPTQHTLLNTPPPVSVYTLYNWISMQSCPLCIFYPNLKFHVFHYWVRTAVSSVCCDLWASVHYVMSFPLRISPYSAPVLPFSVTY